MNKKVSIIAEVGNLHEGSLELAKSLASEAAACGVDSIKFQTHVFDAESLPDAPSPSYFKTESRKEYFTRTAFTQPQWEELKRFTEEKCRLEFLSSVFSAAAVDLMEAIGLKRYKIPSGEVTNITLLEKIATLRKPVLLSCGMSTWKELDTAVSVLKSKGCRDITILQCTSLYPCPPEKAGLKVLGEIKKRYGLPVGFSDHTLGISSAIAAVVMGASVIEKHFALSGKMYGSDAGHSLEPSQMKLFVSEIRDVEKSLAHKVSKDELTRDLGEMKIIFEKSIVSRSEIPQGTRMTLDKIDFKKPGDGIRADRYREIIGKVAKVTIPANTKIKMEMFKA